METVNTLGASRILQYSVKYTRELAEKGILPARKPRGRWIFNKSELESFINSSHNSHEQKVRHGEQKCRNQSSCTNAGKSGGIASHRQAVSELERLLGL